MSSKIILRIIIIIIIIMCVCVRAFACLLACVPICVRTYRSIRVHIRADAEFVGQNTDGDESRIMGYFGTPPQDVTSSQDIDLAAFISDLADQVDHWNARGSGFVIDRIIKFVLCITKYRPLHGGSSFIETPDHIKRKECVVNVVNGDSKCFVWAVLSALYPPTMNANRVNKYIPLENRLNLTGLKFPVHPKQIPTFEQNNSNISVNVLSIGEGPGEFCVEYLSHQKGRLHHINLLLLDDGKTDRRHYVWIKNMSRLVYGRTAHHGSTHVCCSCLHLFSSADSLRRHEPQCMQHAPEMVKYPDPDGDPQDSVVEFRARKKQHRLPFYLVCDFECFLQPVNTDNTDVDGDGDGDVRDRRIIDEHNVCGFACHRVTDIDEHKTDPTVYSGDDVMDKFYEHVMSESRAISAILGNNVPMQPLSVEEQTAFDTAQYCANCDELFTDTNYAVRHHCHVTGNIFSLHVIYAIYSSNSLT